ncbi:hypothetical protein D5281_21640 [bacterium 1xD42-62]|uniref:Uncharacterized protein n=1 Tax=Parablautia muri TaxID=2320879 RepID=A0A9X5BJA9_9FIRM|nr:hypothetical protein [Parablautia muri]
MGIFATWDNMVDYADLDSFNVTFYDKNNDYVTNNIWTKEYMVEKGYEGGSNQTGVYDGKRRRISFHRGGADFLSK